jgi:hypothetical protein
MLVKLIFGFFLFTLCMTTTMVIISLYPNDRTKFFRLHERTSYVTTSSPSLTLSSSYKPTSQYLWCVNHYGPNNQIKDFVKCAIIAIINNYTLIIPPLYPHYGDKIRSIQWFDHFYDLKQLGQVLNFVTLDQFIQQTKNNGKKIMIECYIQQIDLVINRMWYPKNTLGSVERYYKKKIDFPRYVNLSRNFDMNELSAKVKNCSSTFLHIHYTTFRHFFTSPNVHSQQIFQHLSRIASIQSMASQLINQLPQLVIGNNSKTNLTTLAVAHMRLGDHTVMSVSMYIKQILYLINTGLRLTHIHIMCPYLKPEEIDQLTSSLPVPITTTKQLLDNKRFVLSDFLFNVLEQEIAFQAPIFIASPWTTYSATVIMQKVYQDKGIVYLFSTQKDSRPFIVTKQNVKYFDR